jgi:hypothetical protein
MTSKIELEPEALRSLVRISAVRADIASAADAALASSRQPLSVTFLPKDYLLRVYRRRLAKPSWVSRVAGAETFLARLEGYDGRVLGMVALDTPSRAVAVWLDEAATRVIAVLVGPQSHIDGASPAIERWPG